MNPAFLTPSLDTCKALADAGFPQATALAWVRCLGSFHVRPLLQAGEGGVAPPSESAAPTLSEVLAQLPTHVSFPIPHPIFGSLEREHTLELHLGASSMIGYCLQGSHTVQLRIEDEIPVEAAARLYLALRQVGLLQTPGPSEARRTAAPPSVERRMAYAA